MRTLFWNQECQCLQGSRFVLRQQVRKWKSVRFVNKSFFLETAEQQGRKLGLKMKDTYKADGTEAASAEEN